jgi:hypothetical protein
MPMAWVDHGVLFEDSIRARRFATCGSSPRHNRPGNRARRPVWTVLA